MATCGIDWAQDHHDVAIVDAGGGWSPNGASPSRSLDSPNWPPCWPMPVTTQRTRSRSRSRLRAACWSPCCGRAVDRSTRSTRCRWPATGNDLDFGQESDHADAVTLANILRTDRPASSIARRHRTGAIDHRARPGAPGRHLAAYPGRQRTAIAAAGILPRFPARFADRPAESPHPKPERCCHRPHPGQGGAASKPQIAAALRRAGRQRGLTTLAATLHQQLRLPQLRHPARSKSFRHSSTRRAGHPGR